MAFCLLAANASAQTASNLVLTAGDDVTVAGTLHTYTFSVENIGDAQTQYLISNVGEPDGFEFLVTSPATDCVDDVSGQVQCSPFTINPGETNILSLLFDATGAECGTKDLPVEIVNMSDPNNTENITILHEIECPAGDLIITANPAASGTEADSVTYGFCVENTGAEDATFLFSEMAEFDGVMFADADGATGCAVDESGALQCDVATIAAESTNCYEFHFIITDEEMCESVEFEGGITLFTEGQDDVLDNNSAISVVDIECADNNNVTTGDLVLTQNGASVTGDAHSYGFCVQNTGTEDASFLFSDMAEFDNLEFTNATGANCADDVSGSIQCDPVAINAGATDCYTFNFDGAAAECSTHDFQANLTLFLAGTNDNLNTDSATATAQTFCEGEGDLVITNNGVASTDTTVSYSYCVANNGTTNASFLFSDMTEPVNFEFTTATGATSCDDDDTNGAIQCDPVNITAGATDCYTFNFDALSTACTESAFQANLTLFLEGENTLSTNDSAIQPVSMNCTTTVGTSTGGGGGSGSGGGSGGGNNGGGGGTSVADLPNPDVEVPDNIVVTGNPNGLAPLTFDNSTTVASQTDVDLPGALPTTGAAQTRTLATLLIALFAMFSTALFAIKQ